MCGMLERPALLRGASLGLSYPLTSGACAAEQRFCQANGDHYILKCTLHAPYNTVLNVLQYELLQSHCLPYRVAPGVRGAVLYRATIEYE